MKLKLIVLFFIINALLLWAVFSPVKVNKVVALPTPTPRTVFIPTPVMLSSDRLFQLVNDWRVQNGYQQYIKSDFDCQFALERLPEIESNFSHDGLYSLAERYSYMSKSTIAENLAKGYGSEQITFTAWINSPEHLANLKIPYDHSCIETDGTYAVEIFSYF